MKIDKQVFFSTLFSYSVTLSVFPIIFKWIIISNLPLSHNPSFNFLRFLKHNPEAAAILYYCRENYSLGEKEVFWVHIALCISVCWCCECGGTSEHLDGVLNDAVWRIKFSLTHSREWKELSSGRVPLPQMVARDPFIQVHGVPSLSLLLP